MDCLKLEREYRDALADLLLDPARVPAEVRAHMEQCADCGAELKALQGTMLALDGWEGVEPSPFFDARMSVRMREAREEKPAGWLERMQARLMFGTNLHLKPIAAGALALLLLAGGGTFAGLKKTESTTPAAASATVRDLQSLDENAQVFQAMNILDEGDGGSANTQTRN
ncbi:MAG TPA: hypothetical protein VMU92_10425 [Acidobacteriaceae bacterium]|nr:hypothetical protein [Acidobacteriaceae bacterium]